MVLTKEVLDAAYRGFIADKLEEDKYGIKWMEVENLETLIPELFEHGIYPMFDELKLGELDKDISIHILDIENFTYACYLQCMGYCGSIEPLQVDLKQKAFCYYIKQDKYTKETESTLFKFLSEQYSGPQAFAVGDTVFVNKEKADPRIGLHLICHEIMHILASKDTVAKMRGETPDLQDEPVNEFFARLATYFFIHGQSEDVNERKKIAGLTYFDSELFAANAPNHNETLGLYGKLMTTDQYLQNDKWNYDDSAVEYAKALAAFYFCGANEPEP